jgi:hypothetical protein
MLLYRYTRKSAASCSRYGRKIIFNRAQTGDFARANLQLPAMKLRNLPQA